MGLSNDVLTRDFCLGIKSILIEVESSVGIAEHRRGLMLNRLIKGLTIRLLQA